MIRVFVAGLYGTNLNGERAHIIEALGNIKHGIDTTSYLIVQGFAPFCPFVDFLYFMTNDGLGISEGMIKSYTMEWLKKCNAMLVISGKGLGTGVDAEIAYANELKVPIFYNIADLVKWKALKETP